MPARVLDGAALSRRMREDLQPLVRAFTNRAGRPPGLALVLVGDDPASHVYVGSKRTHGTEVGFRVDLHQHPASMSLDAARRVFETIDPAKDVDGFTAENVGRLVQNREGLVACTPAGVIELLERSEIRIAGQRAVVIGRSDIVGKPMALLLLHRHATVTIAHSRSANLPDVAREADILIAAIGRAGFVTPEFVKPGATVVDVGMNRVTAEADVIAYFGEGSARHDGWKKRGSVLMGDVHPGVADVAGALTPVPGGVGPLTIAMLMRNTLTAAERRTR